VGEEEGEKARSLRMEIALLSKKKKANEKGKENLHITVSKKRGGKIEVDPAEKKIMQRKKKGRPRSRLFEVEKGDSS